ncbi:hypothetical protein HNQ57_001180 [Zhongshania antarctica]|uniref:Uncharacterized protein n=1 Tax=Zhongshania antarctica TaxID=641702 RepID=A0A840R2C2_9GAMM|nr:hypothetical protein [Zhongshania antarctica]MBB5186917.1 hypothetical protein [Zhongshania antarctica]
MKFQNIPYENYVRDGESVLAQYVEACDWLDEMGFNYKKTRFRQYKKSIDNFYSSINYGPAEGELESVFHEFLNAYSEATELIRLKGVMVGADFELYFSRLKKVVAGSAFRTESEKDQSRNFSFELSMAARFINGGFTVDLNHEADIVAVVEGVKVYVECKRLRSLKKLSANIKKANEQIKVRLSIDKSSRSRGLIAINTSDVLNPSNDMLMIDSVDNLQRLNSEQLNGFMEENEKALRTKEHKNTLGVFCEFTNQALIHDRDPMALCNCRGANFYTYKEGGSDDILVRAMAINLANQNIF